MIKYNKFQFQIFRLIMGLYMTYLFGQNISYSNILFGSESVFENTNRLFLPSFFALPFSSLQYDLILGCLSLLGVLLAVGIFPRILALVLWFSFASLINYNPFLTWPSEGNVGWLLLFISLIPQPSKDLINKKNLSEEIDIFLPLILGAGFVLAGGYTFSGLNKLNNSLSWQTGMGLEHALTQYFVKDNFLTTMFMTIPLFIRQGLSYFILWGEILSLPMWLINERTKFLSWIILTAMHIILFLTNNLWIVTIPMFAHHLLVFNPQWLRKTSKPS